MSQTLKPFAQVALTRAMQTLYSAPSSGVVSDLVTDIVVSNNTKIDNPQAPTVTPTGSPGTTTHSYYIVANDAFGGKTLVSAAGTTATSNAALSVSNYNAISWPAVQGAVSYDVLKDNMTTSLATGVLGTAINDAGQATAAYTTPTSNTTGIKAFVTLHRVPQSGAASLTNRIVAFFEVDPGIPTDLQMNIPLLPGDMIQGKINSSVNGDASIDNNVSVFLAGMETS